MDNALTATLVAASVSVTGWAVNYVLGQASERNRQKREARLHHIEKQLEQLYGPLFFLLHEGTSSFRDFCQTLGRPYIFGPGDEISPADLETWLFWVDNDLMPRNVAIQELLASNAHLIEGPRMPASYLEFIDHHNSWRVSHLRWKEEGVPYRWRARTEWPSSFERDVIATYEELKRRQAELGGLLAGSR
ncbi:hypothetical protein G3M58_86085 [Streptomyces sp. SID7499]|uniref:Uncharacterized protein n=1 Tax=Streptomyces sp. SID7499 TaxID=2706086 RepID=A0A6G3XVF1_9ACTN|nr:hypothetical protein [Streptomyces sp. SID7499]